MGDAAVQETKTARRRGGSSAVTQRRFCVLTTGRTGSTALMNWLQRFDDIALPNKNIRCPDNELLHPRYIRDYAREYSRLCETSIKTQHQLIQGFFEYNSDLPFAGFKSMPDRHGDYKEFIRRKDIKFIILTRKDIASTVASFVVAMAEGSWKRTGEAHPARWTFHREEAKRALGHLAYIHKSFVQLSRVPGAIRITYEDLCDPGFSCPALDDYFGRPVRIDDPKPPTSARDYVTNWEEFEAFIKKAYRHLRSRRAPGSGE